MSGGRDGSDPHLGPQVTGKGIPSVAARMVISERGQVQNTGPMLRAAVPGGWKKRAGLVSLAGGVEAASGAPLLLGLNQA